MARTKFYITTTAANETASFYLGKGQGVSSTVTATISWGDETELSTITISGSSAQASHSYAEPGNYEATITTTSNAVSIYRSDSVAALSTNITRVHVGDYVNKIGKYAFYNLANIDTVTIGNYAITIAPSAFYKCGVKHIDMSESNVKALDDDVFSNCKKLENIALNDKITTIGANTFYLCSALSEIVLPASLTSIDDNGLGTTGLTTVTIYAKTPPTLTSISFDGSNINTIYVPQDAVTRYTSSQHWDEAGTITALPDPEVPTGITPSIFTFTTTSADEQVAFHISLVLDVNAGAEMMEGYPPLASALIDWGDGISKNFVLNYDENIITYYASHSFTTAGVHIAKVYTLSGKLMFGDIDGGGGYTAISSNVTALSTGDDLAAISCCPFAELNIPALSLNFGSDLKIIWCNGFGNYAFIDKIVIPDTVTYLGEHAFDSLTSKQITIGTGITNIMSNTFSDADIDTLIFKSTEPPTFDEQEYGFKSGTHTMILVPETAVNAYETALAATGLDSTTYDVYGTRDQSSVVPTVFTFTTTAVNEDVNLNFTSDGSVATVNVDWGDESTDSTDLNDTTSTELTHTYTTAGEYTVNVYPVLDSIKLCKISSNNKVCAVTENLTSISTGDYFTTIDDNAVKSTNPITLDSVTLNGDITTLGDNAFRGNTITTFTMGTNVTTIGEYALAFTTNGNVVIPEDITILGSNVFNGASIDTITLNTTIEEIDAGALVTTSCDDLYIKAETPPTMASNSIKLSDGAVIHVPYKTAKLYAPVIEAADADAGNWSYTIVEIPDPNRDPDEYDPDTIEDVPGSPAPEQNMSGDALKSILKAYGKNLKFIKTENNTISVNHIVRGLPYLSSDDLIIRSFNGYDFVEVNSYDSYFRKEYVSLIRINDIRTFVIAKNARDQIDAFRC